MLGQGRDVGGVAHGEPAVVAHLGAERLTERLVHPADGGRQPDHAVGAPDHAGDGDAAADVAGLVGHRRRISARSSASGCTASSACMPRGRSVCPAVEDRPPRPTRAARSRSTSMLNAYAYTRADSGWTSSDGRPARPGLARRRSLTRPAPASSAVSAPIVLRLSPSWVVSSAREVGAVHVHIPEQGPEIVPADLLLARAGCASLRRPRTRGRRSPVAGGGRPCAGTARRRRRRAAGPAGDDELWPALKPIRPMPLSITAITAPPRTASITRPLPPKRLVPPMTAAPTA